MVDGNGVALRESDDIADGPTVLDKGRDGCDRVALLQRGDELLQRGDIRVGLFAQLFELSDPVFQIVHAILEVIARDKRQRDAGKEKEQFFHGE